MSNESEIDDLNDPRYQENLDEQIVTQEKN